MNIQHRQHVTVFFIHSDHLYLIHTLKVVVKQFEQLPLLKKNENKKQDRQTGSTYRKVCQQSKVEQYTRLRG